MFLAGEAYSQAVKDLVQSPEAIDMAIAFWGRGAKALLQSKDQGARRILCNLVSGGTNPGEIQELLGLPHVEIRHTESLHAKVVVGTTMAIVGSANFSANGIGFEGDEAGTWIEAGYKTSDYEHVKQARRWFNALWDEGREITERLLEEALVNWRKNRASRPWRSGDRFVINKDNWRDYLGRPIKLIIWRSRPTATERQREAEDRDSRALAFAGEQALKTPRRLKLDYYHHWDSQLLADLSTTFIDVQYLFKGSARCRCHGARRLLQNGHISKGDWGSETMDVLQIVPDVDGRRFGEEERAELATWLAPLLETHFASWSEEQNPDTDYSGVVIDLDHVLQAAFGARANNPATHEESYQWLYGLATDAGKRYGLRTVMVDTAVPEVRIGTGERTLSWKDESGLKRVSIRLQISSGKVTCGSFLPKKEAKAFGRVLDRQDAKGRTWVCWPLERSAELLPALIEASTPSFRARLS